MLRLTWILAAAALAGTAGCGESQWRRLTAVETREIAKKTEMYVGGGRVDLAVSDDFDGDGRRDEAIILVKGEEAALFVFRGSTAVPLRLSEPQPRSRLWNLGLYVIPPGSHLTACGKGYGDSAEPCRPSITLKSPGIEFATLESASQAYFWNGKAFEREWLSD